MGDANAKRVDLDALRALRGRMSAEKRGDPAHVLADAVAEIEAARAAPAPSPTFSAGSPPAIMAAALVGLADLARAIVQEVRREREAGPPRAARLVAYRCAAMQIAWDAAPEGEADTATAKAADNIARAMLAAERPAE